MNNAISWMIEKAYETRTLEDGTISSFFQGTIPARMKRQIIEASQAHRDGQRETTYSAGGATWGWAASFGARKSTQFSVRFSYDDYTVPASNI